MIQSQSVSLSLSQSHDECSNFFIQRLYPRDPSKKVAAVIVTFSGTHTFDPILYEKRPTADEGAQVSVFACPTNTIIDILKGFKSNQTNNQTIKQMLEEISQVSKKCVVFNWECCSEYINSYFDEGVADVMEFTKLIIDKGFMAMYSDFSLKALINCWDEKILGPLPFQILGQCFGKVKLCFDCEKLKKTRSAQLRIVGQMAVKGFCHLNTLGGTIVFGLNKKKQKSNKFYEIQVLSFVQEYEQMKPIKKKQTIGHALLQYRSGGCLLTSMGHWIQLMNLETTEDAFFGLVDRSYGIQESMEIKKSYLKLEQSERKQFLSEKGFQIISQQSPCLRMGEDSK